MLSLMDNEPLKRSRNFLDKPITVIVDYDFSCSKSIEDCMHGSMSLRTNSKLNLFHGTMHQKCKQFLKYYFV